MDDILLLILVILLLLHLRPHKEHPETLVVSSIDGNDYAVKKNFRDHKKASDILATLNKVNKIMIEHMTKKFKYSNHVEVNRLKENYNENALSEHIPNGDNSTSFVTNKGEKIKLCLRDKKSGDFHDINTLIFVNLHELSHLLDKQYGHKQSFWDSFKLILHEAVKLGLYDPVDYKKNITEYCGINIYSNPYYD